MVKAKTIAERVQDISQRSGLSVDIVQRVLSARADSILNDLKNGMRVVDYGVVSMTPVMQTAVVPGGIGKRVAVKCTASPRIVDTLNEIAGYSVDEEDDDKGSIVLRTIPSFT